MRGFAIALTITLVFVYCLPFANLAAQRLAHAIAYQKHVAPQSIGRGERVTLNSRLLPRFKFGNLDNYLDQRKRSVLWVGNSTQFHVREKYLEEAFGCDVGNFYNMAYHSPDPGDLDRMLAAIGSRLRRGSTVIIAIYPEMFSQIERINSPSLLHPWSTAALWLKNIRDGNSSVSTLFPALINLEWPIEAWSNIPVVTYYARLWSLVQNGFADEFVFDDGSVEFIGAEERNRERHLGGEKIYFDRHIFARYEKSPILNDSISSFDSAIERLTAAGIDVVAFEAVFHPKYKILRKNVRQRKIFERHISGLAVSNPKFWFFPQKTSFVEIPDRLWLDETHVSFEGGAKIVRNHGTYMPRDLICPQAGR